jgi:predicted protein tyrosine phosphatase
MNILFVCRQNIFRSVAAQYLFEKFLKDSNIYGIKVMSAGTESTPEPMNTAVINALLSYGIDVSNHKQRRLSKKDVSDADVIAVMGEGQKIFMKKNYGIDVPYYKMTCCGLDEPLLDVEETDKVHTKAQEDEYIIKTIEYIHDTIPKFYENMGKYKKH